MEKSKITIRYANVDDAKQLCKWWRDGKVMAHAGFPLGLEIDEETIKNKILNESEETLRRLMIEYDHVPVGELNYKYNSKEECEIGIKICNEEYQNHGLGKLVLSQFIEYLFNEKGYSVIVLDTNLENKRAQRVYEQLGFQKLRVNYNSWKDQLGNMQSSVDYRLTKETFHSYLHN